MEIGYPEKNKRKNACARGYLFTFTICFKKHVGFLSLKVNYICLSNNQLAYSQCYNLQMKFFFQKPFDFLHPVSMWRYTFFFPLIDIRNVKLQFDKKTKNLTLI